ncbi:MAG: alpha-L-fucosidase [Candidatus Heimdallarchaeota archaeon]|nr:alpha-L-fucosidase [Candidatus Heimdallarchaeota archaeon]
MHTVIPQKRHLDWLNLELGTIIHFGINTFHDKQWSKGDLNPRSFSPTEVDCDQWIQTSKEMGARYVIFVAKHHDGFCLWKTNTTDYSVVNSSYQGDVVREFISSCRKAEMKFGLYLSPWDRNCNFYDDKEKYTSFYLEQLRELIEDYCNPNEVVEFWFDGANSYKDGFDWDRVFDLLRKHQPECCAFNMGYPDIRWIGNELGKGVNPNYHVILHKQWPEYEKGKKKSDGVGDWWTNVEADFPIRPFQWFYQERSLRGILPFPTPLFSINSLLNKYMNTVGLGANMLLGIGPDRSGRITDKDAEHMRLFGKKLKNMFAEERVILDCSPQSNRCICEFESSEVSRIVLQEDLSRGQRIHAYNLFYWKENTWIQIPATRKRLTIGHKRIEVLPKRIITSKIKFEVIKGEEAILKKLIVVN